ncbi:hypothetical protein Tco_0687617 [Tanacetum coccineum]
MLNNARIIHIGALRIIMRIVVQWMFQAHDWETRPTLLNFKILMVALLLCGWDEGRWTMDIVDGDKELEENVLSTEDGTLSTDKDKVNTDMEKVSTDRPIVSTDGSKVSTDRQIEGTDEQIEEQLKVLMDKGKGTEDQFLKGRIAKCSSSTQTPTSTIFGDDETN